MKKISFIILLIFVFLIGFGCDEEEEEVIYFNFDKPYSEIEEISVLYYYEVIGYTRTPISIILDLKPIKKIDNSLYEDFYNDFESNTYISSSNHQGLYVASPFFLIKYVDDTYCIIWDACIYYASYNEEGNLSCYKNICCGFIHHDSYVINFDVILDKYING